MAQLGAEVIRFDPIGGRARPRALAGHRGRPEPLLGGAEQGQALDPGGPRAPTRGASSWPALVTAPGPDAGLFLTNFPARGLPRLRVARRAPGRPDHGQHRGQPRRLVGGRLHGQPGDGLRLGHGPAQPGRPVQPPAAGVGRDHGHARHDEPARRRAPPRAHRRGPVRAGRALRRGVLDGREPREDRRGAGQPPRAPEGRQLPLRRLRARLPDRRTGGA